MGDRHPRPLEHLLAQPLKPMLGGVGDMHEVHLRNGHLRHIDEQLNSRGGSCCRSHHRRCLKIL
ncbi:hypothetical protein BJX68DRAFT_237015 [Aspergillus pseudodeflectus]|uniref:Uncharacterized protein n=1 Tax=Aspergillus pseudodeflectus TaxID=176178 RepID=A0ABR4KE05_9EURO